MLRQTLTVMETMVPLEDMAKYNAGGQDDDGRGVTGGSDLTSLMASMPQDTGSLPNALFLAKGDRVRESV